MLMIDEKAIYELETMLQGVHDSKRPVMLAYLNNITLNSCINDALRQLHQDGNKKQYALIKSLKRSLDWEDFQREYEITK